MHHLVYSLSLLLLFALPQSLKADSSDELGSLYEKAAELMSENNLDEAQRIFDRAFAVPGVESDDIYPLLLNEQATLYTWRGERRAAIEGKRAVIPKLPDFGDTELDISVYSDLGLLYNRSARIDSALYFFELADSAAKVLGDPGWQASVKQNIGVMYYNLKRFEAAAKYLRQAADFGVEAGDDYSVVCGLQLLASAQIELADTADAGRNARAAWQRALASGNESLQLRCIPALYRYFEAIGCPDSVDHYMAVGLRLYEQMPPQSVISQGYVMAAARMHYNRGEWAEALQWFDRQLHSAMLNDRATLYSQVASCYRNLGEYRQACAYLDSALIVADSMARADAAARLEEFNVKYGAMESEMENATLRVKTLQRERIILVAVLIVIVLACGAIALYRHNRRIRKDMDELNRRRELESAQNYIRGLEHERKYFAKELHDGIANDLLGLKMKVESDFANREEVSGIISATREAVRSISHHLMPPQFDMQTLPEVMRDYVAAISRNNSLNGTFTYRGNVDFSTQVARDVYRITQEYLMNLISHGKPTSFEVVLTADADGSVELRISDDSPVRCPAPGASGRGIGMSTMADRARSMDGTMQVSVDEKGHNLLLLKFQLQ